MPNISKWAKRYQEKYIRNKLIKIQHKIKIRKTQQWPDRTQKKSYLTF